MLDRVSDMILFGCLFWALARDGARIDAALALITLVVSLLTFVCEAIDVWSMVHVRRVRADRMRGVVVGHDEDDIWAVDARRRCDRGGEDEGD